VREPCLRAGGLSQPRPRDALRCPYAQLPSARGYRPPWDLRQHERARWTGSRRARGG
jgi:hypothetical protein